MLLHVCPHPAMYVPFCYLCRRLLHERLVVLYLLLYLLIDLLLYLLLQVRLLHERLQHAAAGDTGAGGDTDTRKVGAGLGTHFTRFTGTKVQVLLLHERLKHAAGDTSKVLSAGLGTVCALVLLA
jgi:hypothetical protein